MKFYSWDINTANSDPSSICEIGIGTFENGVLIDSWREYIDPEVPFDPIYTEKIHGITEEMVRGFWTFDIAYDLIRELFEGNIVVHYSQLSKVAFQKTTEKYDLEPFPVSWFDIAVLARQTWGEFSEGDYGLKEVASFLGIKIGYPNALESSVAIGKIVCEACNKLGIEVEELLNQGENARIK